LETVFEHSSYNLNTNSEAVVVCIVGLTSNVVANRENKSNETCLVLMTIHHLKNHRPIMCTSNNRHCLATQCRCNESSLYFCSTVLLSVSAMGDGANGGVWNVVCCQVIATRLQHSDCQNVCTCIIRVMPWRHSGKLQSPPRI